MYKAVFIDIDDTLLDYKPCCREAFDAAMDALAITGDGLVDTGQMSRDEWFDIFIGISGRLFSEAKHGLHTIAEVMELYPREFIERFYGLCVRCDGSGVEALTEVFKLAFRAAWGQTHTLVPEADTMLERLRAKGYRLYAASNSFGPLQRSRLELAGILPYFEDTFISMDIGYDKPDIRFYAECLRRAGLEASEVVMIGDSMTTDVLGAQAAGIDAIFFDRQKNSSLMSIIQPLL